jgi:hypothetical protein
MKIQCAEPGCRGWGEMRKPYSFHATCARQAGLEVENRPVDDGLGYEFYVKCFRHGSNMYNLRARLEDLIEIEKRRAGKNLEAKDTRAMSFVHAARLLNSSILVMHTLGWAWRWAEWWILYNDSWEPLLEPGQKEEHMSNEEKRIVESSPEIRCEDARKCRLAALSVALRNRSFDNMEQGDTVILDRALRSMLHAKSLVGPLEDWEIDFFAEWLGVAYRSKSRLLGFGEDKIEIRPSRGCVFEDIENLPKYELGSRRLPGLQELLPGQVFETEINDVDDFLKPERFRDGTLVTQDILKPKQPPKQPSKKRPPNPTSDLMMVEPSPKRGRPPMATDESPAGKRRGQPPKPHSTPEDPIIGVEPVVVLQPIRHGGDNIKQSPEAALPQGPKVADMTSPPKVYCGKKRGRKPKTKPVETVAGPNPEMGPRPDVTMSGVASPSEGARRRGRPSKKRPLLIVSDAFMDGREIMEESGVSQKVAPSNSVNKDELSNETDAGQRTEGRRKPIAVANAAVANILEVVERKSNRRKSAPIRYVDDDGAPDDRIFTEPKLGRRKTMPSLDVKREETLDEPEDGESKVSFPETASTIFAGQDTSLDEPDAGEQEVERKKSVGPNSPDVAFSKPVIIAKQSADSPPAASTL